MIEFTSTTRPPFQRPFSVLLADLRAHYAAAEAHAPAVAERAITRFRREVESLGYAVVTVERLEQFRVSSGECEAEYCALCGQAPCVCLDGAA